MEFKLNEDQQLMKDMFVEFTEQFVKPIAAELDEQERFPEELIPQLGETGLLGIPVAEEYGGAGADNMSYVLAVEEVSKACASTGVTISAHTSLCCWPIEAFGTCAAPFRMRPSPSSRWRWWGIFPAQILT